MYSIIYPGELRHHGIKGQKWGVRRYQNEDGSVTAAGAERYYVDGKKSMGGKGGATEKQQKTDNGRSSVSEKTSKFLYKSDDFNKGSAKKRDKIIVKNLSDKAKKDIRNAFNDMKKSRKEWDKFDDVDARNYKGGVEQYRKDYDAKRKEVEKNEARYRKQLEQVGKDLLGKYADLPRPKSSGRWNSKAYEDIAGTIDALMEMKVM